MRLFCLHSFHLRCIIISLKKYTTCPYCQRSIYLDEDDDAWQIRRISSLSFEKFTDKEIKIIQERGAVLIEFTRHLPDISDQEKNRLFDAFSRSNAFRMKEHNAFLDTLADPMKGWDLDNY
ncbi:4595_t:CDS:2 [Funneliformis caledonium]|uniref:4595_t:CDS:1 n=1 Tax=Funneliformis caledonium TaxID=1117310 RepID=A0A9N8W8X4_9GLOM|nr:4595_t:CDS:2 [Funneliformis caledonium]